MSPVRRALRPALALVRPVAALGLFATLLSGAIGLPNTAAPALAANSPVMTGLHVSGPRILNDVGQPLRLLGADRGAANACIQGWGIFSGPADESTVQVMASWQISAVRIPLNEDCWLGINGAPGAYSGANYQQAIVTYVNLLTKYNIAAILDLHWNAPGSIQAHNQQPMADHDHAPAFWTSVANTFKSNTGVVFDLYNEPYPDNNQDTPAAWNCLLNGCQLTTYVDANGGNVNYTWQAAGMNELVQAVRSTGASNLILTAGVGWSGLMTRWLDYKPTDPLNNLAASTHTYPNTWCSTPNCWDTVLAPITAQLPLVVGEMGETDCGHTFIDGLMGWLDQHNGSYLAWHWWPLTDVPCSAYALITDYASGKPSGYGAGLHDHLAALAGTMPSNATVTPTATPTVGATTSATATSVPVKPTATGAATTVAGQQTIFVRGTSAHAVNDGLATALTLVVPTTLPGDVLIAEVSLGSGGGPVPTGVSAPAGWIPVAQASDAADGVLAWAWYRVVGSAEPSSYTWKWTNGSNATGSLNSFANVDANAIFDPAARPTTSTAYAYGGQGRWPGVSTSLPGTMWVVAGATSTIAAVTPDFVLADNSYTVGGNNAESTFAYRLLVSPASATANATYLPAGQGGPQALISFGLKAR